MATVEEVKIQIESSITFRFDNLTNNIPSNIFNFHGRQCTLKMEYSAHNSSYNLYNIKFYLDVTEELFILKAESFKLSVCFNSSLKEHLFTLKSMNGKKFVSDQTIVYEPEFRNYSSFDVNVKINIPQENNCNELFLDMKKLLSDKVYSDIKLETKDKVFNVHKNILAIRNKRFSIIMQSNMTEKKNNIIKLDQWDHQVVEQMLNYIYTNSCNVTIDPVELFMLAHYFEIKPLQNLCDIYLRTNINIKNIVEVLELTSQSQYELTDLKIAVESFIKSNETLLSKDCDYIEYLKNSINENNLEYVLQFSHQYALEVLLNKAIKYVISKYKEVFQMVECKKFLLSVPSLMFQILEQSLEMNQCLLQEQSDE